uniref:Ig-like domain-containing protein n=1 Tax=Anolis carolinensis TaxID=28377 RepID=A0A803TVB7_ANOCA
LCNCYHYYDHKFVWKVTAKSAEAPCEIVRCSWLGSASCLPQISLRFGKRNRRCRFFLATLAPSVMLSPLPSVEILSKPTIPRPPVPFPIENLDSLHLTCNTSSILADVAWLLNRRPLGNSSRIQLSDNNRTLDISPVLRSDAGDYQCRVFNPAFSETNGPGPVVISPDTRVYYEHMDIDLFCKTDCYPPAKYTWIFNGQAYGSGDNVITYDVGLDASGNYTCQAENYMTGDTASSTLEIERLVGLMLRS